MKLIRNYLNGAEMVVIVSQMLQHESAVEREIIKVGIVMQLLVEGLGEFEDTVDLYDAYMAQNDIVFDRDIKNYSDIEKLFKEEISVEKTVKEFLDDVDKKIDKATKKLPKDLKNFKMEDLINQFKEVIDSGVSKNV